MLILKWSVSGIKFSGKYVMFISSFDQSQDLKVVGAAAFLSLENGIAAL